MITQNFNFMVDEAYNLLDEYNNNNINIDKKLILPKIDLEINPTRLYWKNIMDYLNIINRPSDHFMVFIKNELCNKEINWYSGNKLDGIIIHGKGQKNLNLIELIKKYINMFVICSSCKKLNTELIKISLKKYDFKCLSCEMNKTLFI